MSVRRCAPACWRRSGTSATRLRSSRGISGGPKRTHRDRRRGPFEPVLRTRRLRGGSGRRRLGLFARRLQQRREAGSGEAHLSRVRALCCDGLILVPVGDAVCALGPRCGERRIPTVLFGRTLEDDGLDAVTIDNFSASYQATNYLIDLGHKRIGAITGPRHLSTGLDRIEGMQAAMSAKDLTLEPRFVRSGDFREEVAYSAARALLEQPERPTALYVANGLMALGVMRAIADIGLKCPEDVSVASTDNISGHQGPEAQSHAHRASDRRHGERSCAAARRSHETRRRGRGAPCRLSLGAYRRRQLRPAEGVKMLVTTEVLVAEASKLAWARLMIECAARTLFDALRYAISSKFVSVCRNPVASSGECVSRSVTMGPNVPLPLPAPSER